MIVAEVPCSGFYGGIMCQIQGYQLDLPEGRIAMRMTARQSKDRWQPNMAWDMKISPPPEYGAAQPFR